MRDNGLLRELASGANVDAVTKHCGVRLDLAAEPSKCQQRAFYVK